MGATRLSKQSAILCHLAEPRPRIKKIECLDLCAWVWRTALGKRRPQSDLGAADADVPEGSECAAWRGPRQTGSGMSATARAAI